MQHIGKILLPFFGSVVRSFAVGAELVLSCRCAEVVVALKVY
jgi:hypothetical protein